MNVLLIILALVVWYLIGIVGFIYWWTKVYVYTIRDIGLSLYAGLIGPLAWVTGYLWFELRKVLK